MGGRGITTSDARILLVAASRATSNRSKTEFMTITPPIPTFKLPSASNKSSRSVPQGRERHLQAHSALFSTLPAPPLATYKASRVSLSAGLATHTHSCTGRDGHATTAVRVVFATCTSADFFFMKPLNGTSLFLGQRPKSSAWLLLPYQEARPSSFPSLFLTTCPHSHMSSLAGSNYPGSKPFPPVMPHLPFPWEEPPAWPTVLSNHVYPLGLSPQNPIIREALSASPQEVRTPLTVTCHLTICVSLRMLSPLLLLAFPEAGSLWCAYHWIPAPSAMQSSQWAFSQCLHSK